MEVENNVMGDRLIATSNLATNWPTLVEIGAKQIRLNLKTLQFFVGANQRKTLTLHGR